MFADEPTVYSGRRFNCGWSERQQTASDIALRVQELARQLEVVDPAYGLIRPDPGMRRFRPGDAGPVVEMTPAELTDRIERRGRFDPPRFPAAVSSEGYRMLYRNSRLDSSRLSVKVAAGAYEPGANENTIGVWPDDDHALWRDPERGIQVLNAMVEAWEPEWAIASGYPGTPPLVRALEGPSPVRPWLSWTAKPLEPRPNPPYRRPYPYPFPLDRAGPPAEVRAWQGGELRIWP
jgi:hypothetical protein